MLPRSYSGRTRSQPGCSIPSPRVADPLTGISRCGRVTASVSLGTSPCDLATSAAKRDGSRSMQSGHCDREAGDDEGTGTRPESAKPGKSSVRTAARLTSPGYCPTPNDCPTAATPPAIHYFSLRTPLCSFGLPLRIRPVAVSRLNQVLPTLNSLRPLTAPTRRPRPVFFATASHIPSDNCRFNCTPASQSGDGPGRTCCWARWEGTWVR